MSCRDGFRAIHKLTNARPCFSRTVFHQQRPSYRQRFRIGDAIHRLFTALRRISPIAPELSPAFPHRRCHTPSLHCAAPYFASSARAIASVSASAMPYTVSSLRCTVFRQQRPSYRQRFRIGDASIIPRTEVHLKRRNQLTLHCRGIR